ncbi:hypothetical protein A2164_01585 [Candidatus Curtissbacteria bacterium RBG_13_35_7]|uniref:LytR/CpsA/Psr regulator C-terminal domain-containing protein n=1 Tax=Candidatus Curtissbacteria bacterium RBG_13_35_7 TaxID=1797705 RepID=A0A1F5G4E3_9BACT|nr:MAG: hypothetical protein A2164_01585 [Candidatus Curtissbacteria bacterium RBG_13_35_7]
MFTKPMILYLRRKSLEIYTNKVEGSSEKLEFPESIIKDEEILNKAGFEKLLLDFFNKISLKEKKIVIAISEELIFQKTIPQSAKEENTEVNNFFNEIPFDSQKIAKKLIKNDKELLLIATNKDLFENIILCLKQLSLQIVAVVPITLFNITSTSVLNKNDVNNILSNSKILKIGNFLTEEISDKQDSSQTLDSKSFLNKKILVIFIAIIIIIILFIFYFIKKPQFLSKFGNKTNETPSISTKTTISSPTPFASDSPLPSQILDRSKIKIQVVNGTGKIGQASQVKEKLESLNFSDISLENSDKQGNKETKVVFSQKIPAEIKEEIVKMLEDSFAKVNVGIENEIENYDFIITTGDDKVLDKQ